MVCLASTSAFQLLLLSSFLHFFIAAIELDDRTVCKVDTVLLTVRDQHFVAEAVKVCRSYFTQDDNDDYYGNKYSHCRRRR